MMRRLCLPLTALLVCLAWPAASTAAPFVDPLIGVRGTLASSPPVTDPALQPFGSCEDLGIVGGALPEGYLCAPYSLGDINLESLDLKFFDGSGEAFPTAALTHDTENSIFNSMTPVGDTVVRLFNEVFENFFVASLYDVAFTGIVIFTAPGPNPDDPAASFVSVRAVNGVSNVPEPVMLLLVAGGLAAAGVSARRRGAA